MLICAISITSQIHRRRPLQAGLREVLRRLILRLAIHHRDALGSRAVSSIRPDQPGPVCGVSLRRGRS